MRRKLPSFSICMVLVFTMLVSVDMGVEVSSRVKAATIYVGGGGPGNYSTIQEGINAANPGDTVYVFNGHYPYAHINKTINLTGEDKNTTIIGYPSPIPLWLPVVCIEADWVNISGFTIRDRNGIGLNSEFNKIYNNIFINNTEIGINVGSSNNNTISNNIMSKSGYAMIHIYSGIKNNIFNNTISNNTQVGVLLEWEADENYIRDNIFINNSGGIYLHHASNNDIKNNYISRDGIHLRHESDGNNITGNYITNSWQGIRITEFCAGNNISFNYLINNDNGIYAEMECPDNVMTYNNIISNHEYGIDLQVSFDNGLIHHNNFINNTIQANGGILADWDNGYPSGGNYWSDYNGSDFFKGPNQDIPGSDGIGDTSYLGPWSLEDHYPLMHPFQIYNQQNYIQLNQGWNLISLPTLQNDTDIQTVLQSIEGDYDAAQWYDMSDSRDPWKHYHASKPSHMNDLTNIDHTMGLWIHVTRPSGTTLFLQGDSPTTNQSINLHHGWNMVGYPSTTSRLRDDALNNLDFGSDVDAVQYYDSQTGKIKNLEENEYMKPRMGYWIHATTFCVWEVPL